MTGVCCPEIALGSQPPKLFYIELLYNINEIQVAEVFSPSSQPHFIRLNSNVPGGVIII
jgi:hypothetical protein